MIDAEVVEDLAGAEHFYSRWDRLVVDHGTPFSAPAWVIAWLRNPPVTGIEIRIIAVTEGDSLLGILPFCRRKSSRGIRSYSLAGSLTALGTEPVTATGREAEVYGAAGRVLRACSHDFDLIRLEGIRAAKPIAIGLREGYHGKRLSVERTARTPLPVIQMDRSTYESWFEKRPASLRRELMRKRRRCLQDGYTLVTLTAARDIVDRLDPFVDLHSRRWADRGGSAIVYPRIVDMLTEVARRLDGSGRMRASVLERHGQVVSVDITMSTGKTATGWLGGFDEKAARYQPGMQTMLASIEHSWSAGDHLFDLGPGDQAHKTALATSESFMESWVLARRGAPYTSVVQLAPWAVVRRCSPSMRVPRGAPGTGGSRSGASAV